VRARLQAHAGDVGAGVALLALGVWLFRRHLSGAAVFIGDSDRLNTFLNVLTHQVDGIRRGDLAAWDDRMFMGMNVAALPYTFPSPLTYLTALAPAAARRSPRGSAPRCINARRSPR
jgi:hypothetical protein